MHFKIWEFATRRWLIYPMIGMRWNGKDLEPFSLCNSLVFQSWSLFQWGFNMSALYKILKLAFLLFWRARYIHNPPIKKSKTHILSPLFCLNILLYFLVIQFQMHNQMKKQRNLHLWDLIKAFGCCNCSTTHSLDYILSFVFLFPLYLLIKNYVNFLSSNFLHFNKFHPFF